MRGGLPEISVIIPCYNASTTIAETIESALKQAANTEIIVIDDGSMDNSAEIIRSFGLHVTSKLGPNRGVSAARNEGTRLARGKFLQYLDADDTLANGTLRARLESLETTAADVAYTDWQKLIESEDGRLERGEIVSPIAGDCSKDVEVSCAGGTFWCPPAALMYRRTIVDKIGRWNPDLPIIQDARFIFDAAVAGGRFVRVPGVGAYYRVRANSLSRRDRAGFLSDCLRNAREVDAFWTNGDALSVKRAGALALQLHVPFDVSFSSDGLVCASPNGPCDDVSGVDPFLGKADGDAADFLDRPTDQWR